MGKHYYAVRVDGTKEDLTGKMAAEELMDGSSEFRGYIADGEDMMDMLEQAEDDMFCHDGYKLDCGDVLRCEWVAA